MILKKRLLIPIVISIAIAFVIYNYAEPKLNFIKDNHRVHSFSHTNKVFPTVKIPDSINPWSFTRSFEELNNTYIYKGKQYNLEDFLVRSQTTGFMVIHKGKVVRESYYQGYNSDSRATSFSVAKSFVSTLVGILYDQGKISSLQDPISDYVPILKKSGFNGVSIKRILQMSSGIQFSEDYSNRSADVFTFFDNIYLFFWSCNSD